MEAIVLDWFERDLHHLFAEKKADDEKLLLKSMGIQIARALNYLHVDAQIVHVDVKPKNILWRGLDNKVALADFGLAECIAPAKPFREVYCTANYRPPELWSYTGGGQTPGNLLQPAVDMWSFGCTWWQLVVDKTFFLARAEGKLGQVIE